MTDNQYIMPCDNVAWRQIANLCADFVKSLGVGSYKDGSCSKFRKLGVGINVIGFI